jgi:DNA topoisomerase VI subunit A
VNEDELIKDLSFLTHLTRDEFVYWFYDKGLIKIHLTFKDGHVEKVTTERLGRLGVEIRHV